MSEVLIAAGVILGLALLAGALRKQQPEPLGGLPLRPGPVPLPPLPPPPAAADWLSSLIRDAAAKHGVPADTIYGVIMAESSGNPSAVNPSDPSAGLMQVTPLIGRAYGGLTGSDQDVLQRLMDPAVNVRAGTAFLRHLQLRYDPYLPREEWVQAYNLGETKFDRGVRNPEYGRRVESYARSWRG